MDAFPAFVSLAGRRVIIVGMGREAQEKAALFVGSPATLVRLPADAAALRPETYAGAAIVFIADQDWDWSTRARAAAKAAGALVNVVDKPALCDFYTPAIVDRGPVVGAIGSTGSAPGLARRLKTELNSRWPEGLGRVAAMIGGIKAAARAALPEFEARRDFLDTLLDSPAADAALAGDLDAAHRLAREALAYVTKASISENNAV
jgi:precorrin-2 dehydrogenase/sirohydrochlorin ferrochelatase